MPDVLLTKTGGVATVTLNRPENFNSFSDAQVPDILAALRQAKAFIDRGVRGGAAWRLGAGHGPIDHFGWESSS